MTTQTLCDKIRVTINYTLPTSDGKHQGYVYDEEHWSPNPLESWRIYHRVLEKFKEERHTIFLKEHGFKKDEKMVTLTPKITHSFWKGPGHLDDYEEVLKKYREVV